LKSLKWASFCEQRLDIAQLTIGLDGNRWGKMQKDAKRWGKMGKDTKRYGNVSLFAVN